MIFIIFYCCYCIFILTKFSFNNIYIANTRKIPTFALNEKFDENERIHPTIGTSQKNTCLFAPLSQLSHVNVYMFGGRVDQFTHSLLMNTAHNLADGAQLKIH